VHATSVVMMAILFYAYSDNITPNNALSKIEESLKAVLPGDSDCRDVPVQALMQSCNVSISPMGLHAITSEGLREALLPFALQAQ